MLGPADASADLERRLRQPVPRVRSTVRLDDDRVPNRARTTPSGAASAPPPAPVQPAGSAEAARTTLIRQPIPPSQVKANRSRAQQPSRDGRGRTAVLVVIVLLCLALVAAGVFALLGLRQHAASGAPSAGVATSAPASTAATPVKLTIAGARDFDPQGDPPQENPGEVKYAYDGDPTTRWRTSRYLGSPKLGNLKRGVGLVVDLGSVQTVGSVAVSLSGAGTDLQIRVPKGDPSTVTKPPMGSDADWHSVGKADKATKTTTIDLTSPVGTRYLLVYLTSLPAEGGGYRGGVYEIDVYS